MRFHPDSEFLPLQNEKANNAKVQGDVPAEEGGIGEGRMPKKAGGEEEIFRRGDPGRKVDKMQK